MDSANSRWTPPADEYGHRGTEVSSLGRFKGRQNSIKEVRGCSHWKLTTELHILGVGCRTHYQETTAFNEAGQSRWQARKDLPPSGRKSYSNLLGQHLLTQMEVIFMTNYWAFFDTSWKRRIGIHGIIGWEIIPGKYRLLLPPGVKNMIRGSTPNFRDRCPPIPGN